MDIVNRRRELLGGWDLVPDAAIERPAVRTLVNEEREFEEIQIIGQPTTEFSVKRTKTVFSIASRPRADGSGETFHLYIESLVDGVRLRSVTESGVRKAIVCDQPFVLEILKTDPRFFFIDDIRPHAVRVTFKNAAGSPTTLFVARQGWSSDGAGGRRVATEVEPLVITDGEPITAEQAKKAAEVLLRIKAQAPPHTVFAAKTERRFAPTPSQHLSLVKGISGP